jgi:hypothetical protein
VRLVITRLADRSFLHFRTLTVRDGSSLAAGKWVPLLSLPFLPCSQEPANLSKSVQCCSFTHDRYRQAATKLAKELPNEEFQIMALKIVSARSPYYLLDLLLTCVMSCCLVIGRSPSARQVARRLSSRRAHSEVCRRLPQR